MSERTEGTIAPKVTAGPVAERAPMTWRQSLIAIGMFSLVIALFAAIGFKEKPSVVLVGKLLGGVGLAAMVVGFVANAIHAISSKAKRGRAKDGGVGTTPRS
jgi:hypothetical protein